jgi:hypothetical protein
MLLSLIGIVFCLNRKYSQGILNEIISNILKNSETHLGKSVMTNCFQYILRKKNHFSGIETTPFKKIKIIKK